MTITADTRTRICTHIEICEGKKERDAQSQVTCTMSLTSLRVYLIATFYSAARKTLKLKVKGRAAVDPDSELAETCHVCPTLHIQNR